MTNYDVKVIGDMLVTTGDAHNWEQTLYRNGRVVSSFRYTTLVIGKNHGKLQFGLGGKRQRKRRRHATARRPAEISNRNPG